MLAAALRLSRDIAAPRERVWRLWTEPALLRRWWGASEGLELFLCEMDLRPGGAYRFAMRPIGAEGPVEAVGGTYEAVEPPELLVFTWDWGAHVRTRVTVRLAALAPALTRVAILHENQPDARVAATHEAGWTHMLADLAAEVSREGP